MARNPWSAKSDLPTEVLQPQEHDLRPDVLATVRALSIVVLSAIALQRVGIPFAGSYVSPVLLIALGAGAYLRWHGHIREDRALAHIFLLSFAGITISALINAIISDVPSLASLALVLLVYIPFLWRVPGLAAEESRVAQWHVLRLFIYGLVPVALASVMQMAAQLSGLWSYTDLFAAILPTSWLVPGYQPSNLVSYGTDLYRSNGVVMLEASFCSQFMALGVIAVVVADLRPKIPFIILFLLGLICTVSGTGILLLAVAVLVLAGSRGAKFFISCVAIATVLLGVVLASPFGSVYTSRLTEITTTTSSANQRFVAPYLDVISSTSESLHALLIGEGPGFADREALEISNLTGAPRISPALTKLVSEYGLLSGLMLAFAIGVAFCRGSPTPALSAAVVTLFFLLSGSLLQAQTVFTAWALTSPILASSKTALTPAGQRSARLP